MLDIIKYFKKSLYCILLFLLGIVIIASVIDLGITLWYEIIDKSLPIYQGNQLTETFSLFLLVLIGIEFFDTIVVYMKDNAIHVEIIIMVAIIAVSRKIILMDSSITDMHLIGLGVLTIALGVSYYLVKTRNLRDITEVTKR